MQFDIFIEPIPMSENTKHTILDPAGQLTVLLLGLCTRCHNVSRLNEMLWADNLSGERHYGCYRGYRQGATGVAVAEEALLWHCIKSV